MIADDIREKLSRDPFRPFVIRASSGKAFKVVNPAMVVLQKSQVFIAEPNSDRSATVPYLHVSSVEGLESGGAGHPKRRRPQ